MATKAQMAKLKEWDDAAKALTAAKEKEMELRKEIFGIFFKDPKEGTNTADLDNDWVLKGVHKINRKIDEDHLAAAAAKSPAMKELIKTLVKFEPKLVKGEFNKLDKTQLKKVSSFIIATPGSPSLEIVLPKAKSKKGYPYMSGE